jgi:hypothetical protein
MPVFSGSRGNFRQRVYDTLMQVVELPARVLTISAKGKMQFRR